MTALEAGRRARYAAAWRSGPLGVPAFRLLTVGQFTSTLGDYCYAVALPWLVLSGHGSVAALGAILACYGIPRAALTTLGGSLADRIGPRVVMLCSDVARCALAALFAVFAADHVTSLAALAPIAAVLGGCSALFLPASYAIMPSLLAAERLPTANAVYNTALQTGALLGPVLGGAVVAAAGPAVGLGIDAVGAARHAWPGHGPGDARLGRQLPALDGGRGRAHSSPRAATGLRRLRDANRRDCPGRACPARVP